MNNNLMLSGTTDIHLNIYIYGAGFHMPARGSALSGNRKFEVRTQEENRSLRARSRAFTKWPPSSHRLQGAPIINTTVLYQSL